MKIARVTVSEGKAIVEVDGLDVPVIVSEGQSLSLDMLATNHGGAQTLSMEWVEIGGERTLIAAVHKPG